MNEWRFEKKTCNDKERGECFFINVYNNKKKVLSFEDPFGLDSCACEAHSDERSVFCNLKFTSFQLTPAKRALLVTSGQFGEAGGYHYRLYNLENKKLKLLWHSEFGTGEIMSLDNSILKIRDSDKNKRDEIYYTEIRPYSSGPFGAESTDTYDVTSLEYDSKKKKMVDKKPNVIWAVKVESFKTHQEAHKFFEAFSCDGHTFYVFPKEQHFEKLSPLARSVAAIAHTQASAKAILRSVRQCDAALKPKLVKIDL